MWNILNGIPVVGHAKGLVHYAIGDLEGGNKAMLDSTRSTAVLGAGAVGLAAGPVGSAALGALAGAAWDSVETVATGKPTGIIDGIGDIVESTSKGELPTRGIVKTSLSVTSDVLGGIGGGGIAMSISNAAGQTAATTIGKSVGKSTGDTILKSASVSAGETFVKSSARTVTIKGVERVIEQQAVQIVTYSAATRQLVQQNSNSQHEKSSQQGSNSSDSPPTDDSEGTSNTTTASDSTETGTGGSGHQPPQRNSNNVPRPHIVQQQQQISPLQEFLNIFEVDSLDKIIIKSKEQHKPGRQIFKDLQAYQKRYLKNLLKDLRDGGYNMKKISTTLVNMFQTMEERDVTFVNFISLLEFTMQYIGERVYRRIQISQGRVSSDVVTIVCTEILTHDYTILRVFEEIRGLLALQDLPIEFRNIFSAIYHYYKHRYVGEHEMTVEEYCALLRENLETIMNTQEYTTDFLQHGRDVRYTRYYGGIYGRRLFIVIRWAGTRVVLSTGYFLDDTFEGDQDGDTYINGRRM